MFSHLVWGLQRVLGVCPWADGGEGRGDSRKLSSLSFAKQQCWLSEGTPIGDPGRSVNPGLKGHDLSMWTGPEMSGAEGGRGPWGPRIPLMLHSPVCNPSAPLLSFKTKRGRQVCADPSEDWVQEYITDLELNP